MPNLKSLLCSNKLARLYGIAVVGCFDGDRSFRSNR
jgi:hypothetical protein